MPSPPRRSSARTSGRNWSRPSGRSPVPPPVPSPAKRSPSTHTHRWALGLTVGSVIRGTILNYIIFIGHYRGQPIQQAIKMSHERPILTLVQRAPVSCFVTKEHATCDTARNVTTEIKGLLNYSSITVERKATLTAKVP